MTEQIIIGIIGGGQLGKLLLEKGEFSNQCRFRIYSPEQPLVDPQKIPYKWVPGELNDAKGVAAFGRTCHIVTYEIEEVSLEALFQLQNEGVLVRPDPKVLEIIQNKARQKEFLLEAGFPTPAFIPYEHVSDLSVSLTGDKDFPEKPWINKRQRGGYDGHGVQVVGYEQGGVEVTPQNLFPGPALIEEKISIEQELSVIIGRNVRGESVVLPISEMFVNDAHQLDFLICPARLRDEQVNQIQKLAQQVADRLELVGVLAIELFIDHNRKIWINEMAPRPHNSGHHHVECCQLDQYKLLAHCLLDLDLKKYGQVMPHKYEYLTLLMNILGDSNAVEPRFQIINDSQWSTRCQVEWYGKSQSRPGRKLGHLTYVALDGFKTPTHPVNWPMLEPQLREKVEQIRNSYQIETVQVGVIMGSLSDLSVVQPAIEVLKNFGVHHEIKIVSAHRTPAGMLEYAQQASGRGLKVIIAAAGGAAHLPGMVASATNLPVIGIPVRSSNSIDGWDSLLSIAQMPGGIPVGTMAINGALNAGLYAIRILAIGEGKKNNELTQKLIAYQQSLEEKVVQQNKCL